MKMWLAVSMTFVFSQLHAQENLSAYVFLSPECPLSQNYTTTLNALQKEFKHAVNFIGVIPGKSYSKSEIRNYIKDYKISFPVLEDSLMTLVQQLHATVTPEVILINQHQVIQYRGAIDDWAISLGKKKLKPANPYLRNAIELLLSGNTVIVHETKPIGCLINEY